VPLRAREVYALAVLPDPLIAGIERGFGTNPMRAGDERQLDLFRSADVEPEQLWPISEPPPEAACRVEILAELPATLGTGATATLPWRMVNQGGAVLHAAEPFPVQVGARWVAHDDGSVTDGMRAKLPGTVAPGTSTEGEIVLTAPDRAAAYTLILTAVQEGVRWFDAVEATNATSARVQITG